MSIIRWKSNHDTTPAFPGLFNRFWNGDLNTFFENEFEGTLPAVNISETNEGFLVEMASPGMKKEDFSISVENNALLIKAEKQEKKEENKREYTRREFSYQSFQRSFTLPNTVDSDRITAEYKEGILSLNIPKKEEAKAKPQRNISIG